MKRLLEIGVYAVTVCVLSTALATTSRAAINAKDVAGVWLFDEGKGSTATD